MGQQFYDISRQSKKEQEMMGTFVLQRDDARDYFLSNVRPRLDRSYKLYISYTGDRAEELKRLGKTWMANIFVPYTNAVVETLMPRILDARPDFIAQGRTEEDQVKTEKLNQLSDYTWEVSAMDNVSEEFARASLVYGTGFVQVGWKKEIRKQKFLKSANLLEKKYVWKEEERLFYDAPFVEAVDNYGLWYDWHNTARESKQFWFKRLLLTKAEIKRKYPMADPKRLKWALSVSPQDTEDYASIRTDTKLNHDTINKGDNNRYSGVTGDGGDKYNDNDVVKMHEVFEWWRPFDDEYAVMINEVPVLKGASIPIPYDFKEAPFIDLPFLKLPFEFEGLGLPLMLENPQIMLNTIKNQRLDAVTLNIHKMWIVNPLANINKEELVVRPFGIIYSADPNGVKEVMFSDVKASAYKEEEMLKSDLRYASGVDDFSMAVGSGAGSATEIRHLRESTLERVRLFINHMGFAYATMMRYWITLYKQFFTEDMTIRIIGEDGRELFPIIEKDDLKGEFDFKAAVYPSIAGKNDIDKKQGMDLFQLLIDMPFVDPQKLTSKVLHSWNWNLNSVSKQPEQAPPGMMGEGQQIPPEMAGGNELPVLGKGEIPDDVMSGALGMLGGEQPPFSEAGAPIDLLQEGGAVPPTAPSIPAAGGGKGGANPRGLNRKSGGRVNTNISQKAPQPDANLANRASNIQR